MESLTQANLESLTTRELINLADIHGVDIPPGLDRIFIIEELLELAAYEETEEEYTEEPAGKFPVSVVLPKQYNITFIDILVRDPLWIYAFWEIKGADRETLEKTPDFNGYFLKVSPWGRAAPDEIFTVPLSPDDNARYLGFPPNDENSGNGRRSFKVELFAGRGSDEMMLAASDPFVLPALSPRMENNGKNPLIGLSGAGKFSILRNKDRQSRAKR